MKVSVETGTVMSKKRFDKKKMSYASFKNIKFPRGNYQTVSSETETLYRFYCSPLNFLLHIQKRSLTSIVNYFLLFTIKPNWKPKINKRIKTDKKPTKCSKFGWVLCLQACLLTKIFTGGNYPFGHFFSRRALWADSAIRGWTLLRHVINLNQSELEKIYW